MKARLTLKIRANARKTEFTGKQGEIWKLHVAAPPIDGKANEAIVRFLARLSGVPATSVRIVNGFTSTTKIAEIDGIDPEDLQRAILESHGSGPDTGCAQPRKT
jgi:uncharacterized protein YggU (UPF0235/DUF167 family)